MSTQTEHPPVSSVLALSLEAAVLRTEGRLAIGAPLRAVREAAGLSKREVAGVLGVSPSAIALYEAGLRTPRGLVAERLALLLRRLEAVLQ